MTIVCPQLDGAQAGKNLSGEVEFYLIALITFSKS